MAHGFRGLSWWGGHGEGDLLISWPHKVEEVLDQIFSGDNNEVIRC